MWWSITFGVACVVTAIYLLITERKPRQRYKPSTPAGEYRRSRLTAKHRAPRKIINVRKTNWAGLWPLVYAATKTSAVAVGRVLYGLYAVARFVVIETTAVTKRTSLRLWRQHRARRERKRSSQHARAKALQSAKPQTDEATLTEEKIRKIQKQGLLDYLKGK